MYTQPETAVWPGEPVTESVGSILQKYISMPNGRQGGLDGKTGRCAAAQAEGRKMNKR